MIEYQEIDREKALRDVIAFMRISAWSLVRRRATDVRVRRDVLRLCLFHDIRAYELIEALFEKVRDV